MPAMGFLGGKDMNWITPGVPKMLDPIAQVLTPEKKKPAAAAAPGAPATVYPSYASNVPQGDLQADEQRTILG